MQVMKKAVIRKRKYISIAEIQQEYLPLSKKKIRILVKRYLLTKIVGNRFLVDREQLEALLKSTDIMTLDLS